MIKLDLELRSSIHLCYREIKIQNVEALEKEVRDLEKILARCLLQEISRGDILLTDFFENVLKRLITEDKEYQKQLCNKIRKDLLKIVYTEKMTYVTISLYEDSIEKMMQVTIDRDENKVFVTINENELMKIKEETQHFMQKWEVKILAERHLREILSGLNYSKTISYKKVEKINKRLKETFEEESKLTNDTRSIFNTRYLEEYRHSFFTMLKDGISFYFALKIETNKILCKKEDNDFEIYVIVKKEKKLLFRFCRERLELQQETFKYLQKEQ